MRYALIEGERIAQVADEPFEVAAPLRWVEAPDGTAAEDRYVDGEVVKAAPVAPVPGAVSDRQFFQALAVVPGPGGEPRISKAEALAAVKAGDLPPALLAMLGLIEDPDERFAAEMLLSGATSFERGHPLTETIGAAQGMGSAEVDDFFRFAATL